MITIASCRAILIHVCQLLIENCIASFSYINEKSKMRRNGDFHRYYDKFIEDFTHIWGFDRRNPTSRNKDFRTITISRIFILGAVASVQNSFAAALIILKFFYRNEYSWQF